MGVCFKEKSFEGKEHRERESMTTPLICFKSVTPCNSIVIGLVIIELCEKQNQEC